MLTPETTWPLERLGAALEALARRAGLAPRPVEPPAVPDAALRGDPGELAAWVMAAAQWLDIAVHRDELDLADALSHAGPALLELPGPGPPRLLALLRARGRQLIVLGSDGDDHVHSLAALTRLLGAPAAARRACWLLRGSPRASLLRQARALGLTRWLAGLVAAQAAQHALLLLSFWLLGRAALAGQVDRGWLLGWTLLLLSLAPLRALSRWIEGVLILGLGGLLKERLLRAAASLAPAAVRHHGAGQLLGRIHESDTMENYLLLGGLQGLVGVVELVFAAGVLALGAGGAAHAGLLALWLALTLLVARRYLRDRCRWTEERVDMTHGLVENIVGHRTRLVQQQPHRWHEGDDHRLARLFQTSRTMDRSGNALMTLVPRAWLPFAALGLAPALLAAGPAPALAVGLGGVLLAHRGLRHLALGLWYLCGATAAWRQLAVVLRAAEEPEPPGLPALVLLPPEPAPGPVLSARGLRFGHRERGRPVLRGASLTVARGDHVVLRGPSGAGKSTLAALLAGLQRPHAGAVQLAGLDRHSLGARGWARRVALAPQFHDNHVFDGSLAFNLLLSRRWPPTAADLAEAAAICHELGLGPLLARMPHGLDQRIGEAGWRLSHGERGRVFLARALLQRAELVVLDEALAALDPESALIALACIRRRAPAALLIEQP